ncbi:hypothetical protein K469DRAFT_521101, partial [Zopfia rhizophila CBS 207.26]
NIILTSPRDLIPWLFIIQDAATKAGVWKYIDPSQTNVPTLTEPQIPYPKLMKPDAISIAELDNNQIQRLDVVYHEYENKKRYYIQQRSAINQIGTYITTTI